MKKLLIALSLAIAATGAYAKDEKAPTAQQSKMAGCNKEAKDMKGDERKAFMSGCLSNKPASEPKKEMTAQQTKMGNCNKEAKAKEMKGDARKAFMKDCLSNKPADAKAATPATPATPAKPADTKK